MERALPYTVDTEGLLTELLEYMDDRTDIVDSDLGPSPNKEMNFATEIRQVLFQIEKSKSNNKCMHDWENADVLRQCKKCGKTGVRPEAAHSSQAFNFDNEPPII
jgi:hypothetical protein